MTNKSEAIRVACAIIVRHGRVLAAQRPGHKDQGGKWEFPGGKLHEGESPADCIVREIWEELEVGIAIAKQLPSVVHSYPNKTVRLIPFIAHLHVGANPNPHEHDKIEWLLPAELSKLDWSDADRKLLAMIADEL